jgi:hypothetical protein
MFRRLIFSALFFATLAMATTAQATTFYVDNAAGHNGSDGNACTLESAPCLTIQGGITKMTAAGSGQHTVLIKTGTYAISSSVTLNSNGGSEANRLTIKNYPGHAPVIDATGAGANPAVCLGCNNSTSAQSTGYITLEGLEIRAGGAGVKFLNSDHIIIRNNYIHDNRGSGILAGGISNIVDRNRISHNGVGVPLNPGAHGMYVGGSNWAITNNIIEFNLSYGIQLKSLPFVSGVVPGNNPAYYGPTNFLIANNVLAYQQNRNGIVFDQAGGANYTDIAIYNNIQIHDGTNNPEQAILQCSANAMPNNTGVKVRNNLGYRAGGTAWAVYSNCGTLSCPNCEFSSNSVGNVNNPNLVNAVTPRPASPDFHLTTRSTIAIDAGLNLSTSGIITDFAGMKRPVGNGYDTGAYEFSSDTAPLSPPRNLKVQ